MAEVRPFRGLRYTSLADPALCIAPPFDVISPSQQTALYERSPHNIVRIEYGAARDGDSDADNRYTRAAADLAAWRRDGVLAVDDAPAIYRYDQTFTWDGARYTRQAIFCALRLEPWERGIVKPHEHTLANPKADRLSLLRATRAQVSPVYSLFNSADEMPPLPGETIADFESDGHGHRLTAVRQPQAIQAFTRAIADAEVYIADGHHRYETALAYRDEVRAATRSWTGDEAENFVLMALTSFDDAGLLVLPTHRLITGRDVPHDAVHRLAQRFEVSEIPGGIDAAIATAHSTASAQFVALGLREGSAHALELRDRAAVEAAMPRSQPAAWKGLAVHVLQYGVLLDLFGIDDAALTAGGAVTYTQDADEAARAVQAGDASAAFLLHGTPIEQMMAVADAGGRMPQKSTYFYPKLPTGLVLRTVD